ncbi:sodium/potassium-transporting ATPase subunit beta-2 isoform X2 [Motacilla alba alba]|uniref:sodium/potassium-transporting ATPase subunit beta-2 isoform X2 n=1 Tax=Motacilla alba alba TaxID=1094192 RepID=UPI0018D58517|nr:sodium/potassium-transporting ATPase subunit beta-2 isoform X2 [Motacilla alba alba]
MARDKEKRSCGQVVAEWRAFLWDPRTRQFLGRTGSSWGLILLFYLVFYGFLAGLFALTMWVMLQSVDPHVPKYQDRLLTPGLMIRPCTEGLDVTFNVSQSQTWHQYVRALHQFLEPYNDSVQAARNAACAAGRYNEQPDDAVPNYPKRACRFERSRLGPCAGLGPHGDYGYGSGRPCVLVKVNRVINFFPGKNKSINIICAAKGHSATTREEDAALLGPMQLFPPNGTIDLMYFPYYGKRVHVNYTQPVVAVQFSNATANVDHHVECRLNAAGLRTDDERDKFAGRVAFRLRINRD